MLLERIVLLYETICIGVEMYQQGLQIYIRIDDQHYTKTKGQKRA